MRNRMAPADRADATRRPEPHPHRKRATATVDAQLTGSMGNVMMEIMVLAVPGCPNAPVLEARLAEALAGRPPVTVIRQVIADEREAARWGMHGSPTLLINGHDPFTDAGTAEPAVACRLYRGEDGRLAGAPSVAALRRVLDQAGPQGLPPAGGQGVLRGGLCLLRDRARPSRDSAAGSPAAPPGTGMAGARGPGLGPAIEGRPAAGVIWTTRRAALPASCLASWRNRGLLSIVN